MSQKPASHYPEVNPNPDFPKIEEAVLAGWKATNAFKKSIENRKDSKEFIFYDGPPFANGLPHYGHLLTGYVKDLYARYQTMRGKRVDRRFGWDCHGLPAEMGSEKELGISGRAAIEKFGIDKFNEHCRTSVMKYTQEWEDYVTRQARWVDFKNDYKTMDVNFMESVLWAFKQLYDKGLVYEAHRVMPYSWAAETPLSNFETKLDNSYREREDKAIYVAFEIVNPPQNFPKANKHFIVAWTTTPWTLPSNLALAVNKEMEYEAVLKDGNCYILTHNAADKLRNELGVKLDENSPPQLTVNARFRGNELVGRYYKPLFPYFWEKFKDKSETFQIIAADFVTDGDGTGIVHIAPGFGEDDQRVAAANGIEVVVPVDEKGRYTDEIFDIEYSSPLAGEDKGGGAGDSSQHSTNAPHPTFPREGGRLSLRGLNVIADTRKDEHEPYKEEQLKKFGLANLRIIAYLKKTGQLIKEEQIKHNYPHCWRTDQPLIYRAMPSWYVEVTKFRDRAVELNKQINWIPEHIRDGQMGHMLATAPDWSISRNRFWGTPIPVWRSKSGKVVVCGSIAEIEKLSGKKVKDLHRPYIDEITFNIDGEEYTRVTDVFDCWFESGSMPFAQVHYPFENKEWFESHFPADFITEYVGQTRGWFNTLIMLSTALFDKAPFKNCICHGVVLDSETGLKYSKRLKNYKDPMEVMDKFGADALRWLMISSPVMRGQDLAVDPEGKFIRDVVRLAIKPIWNAYNFFTLYANADGVKAVILSESEGSPSASRDSSAAPQNDNVMDRYILAKCKQAVETIQKSLDAYDTPAACDAVMQFFEVLNNWYIRRNKERFWAEEKTADKQAAYDTLYTVLETMCRAAAPLLPLTLDDIYKGLTGEESVHLQDYPTPSLTLPRYAGEGKEHPLSPKGGELERGANDDAELIAQMDWVRDVCNAALAIRSKNNIRVRQPLKDLKVVWEEKTRIKFAQLAKTEAHLLLDVIKDEVNVKEITLSDQSNNPLRALADFKLSINSPALGKRLPALMKQILPASKKGEWKPAPNNAVEICGEVLRLDEFSIQLEPKPEYKDRAQALSTNDALVILDTTVTPELEAEGIARDMVRAIQQARKDGGLNVSDRIRLHLDAPADIASAISTHSAYILEQTLSTELLDKLPTDKIFSAESAIDEKKVIITLAKAA
ncbi:MAG: isoleucine--tRNA ligase [Alphaproteobacteria bacterium]